MTTWHDLSSLPEQGEVLVLDARSGDRWVSSFDGKPWKHDATHWCDLPDAKAVCEAWHADYKRLIGEFAYGEWVAERAASGAKRQS